MAKKKTENENIEPPNEVVTPVLQASAKYTLTFDPMAVTTAQLGIILLSLGFAADETYYNNFPEVTKKFFVKNA